MWLINYNCLQISHFVKHGSSKHKYFVCFITTRVGHVWFEYLINDLYESGFWHHSLSSCWWDFIIWCPSHKLPCLRRHKNHTSLSCLNLTWNFWFFWWVTTVPCTSQEFINILEITTNNTFNEKINQFRRYYKCWCPWFSWAFCER